MVKINLDEEFLEWWERNLEKEGYDMDEKQLRFLTDPAQNLYCNYSYRNFFQAVRREEYGPLMAYNFAHQMYIKSKLEEVIKQEAAKIISSSQKKSRN